jgi:hypothetical protein
MHVSFDTIVPAQLPERLPIQIKQSTSRTSIALKLLLLLPALVIVAVPLALLAAHAVAEPTALNFLANHPLTTVQITLAVAFCTLLFVRPLQRLLARAGATRLIDISSDTVSVTERGPFRTCTWSAPLASYRGVAHHVRTSLSGVRHEMILIHPDPTRHVLLAASDKISANTLARTAALLGLSEVHARELYSFERWSPEPVATTPAPHLMPAQT